MDRFDLAVVGAGAVGLAIAHAAATDGARVVVLERHPRAAQEQSTHNSGVIHAGFLPTPGTLRSRLNVEGNRLLYARSKELGFRAEPSGTLVVAQHASGSAAIDRWLEQGRANGVLGIERVDRRTAMEREPHLGACIDALFAPTGGRVDAPGLVRALETAIRSNGGEFRFGFRLAAAGRTAGAWTLRDTGGLAVSATGVVNCAGVASAEVAAMLGAYGHRIYPCLGEYAHVREGAKRDWLRSMIYGLPPPGYPGVGVHLTRTLDGELWIGPTATYQEGETPPAQPVTPLEEFAREAAAYLPGLSVEDLVPGHAGVRAKPVPPGGPEAFSDFLIREEPPGSRAIQLVGIESPGLTSCFAVGEYVVSNFASRWQPGS